MPHHMDPERLDAQRQMSVLVDGILRDGVDALAERRAHMRDLTMARQAAERRHDRPVQLIVVRERTVELRTELARLNAEHRTWLHEQGEDVAERPTRRRRVRATAPQ